MNNPKRHHWWPQLNSGHWCNSDGKIHVLNRDGTSFWGRPGGLGVVGHLYSREMANGAKDTSIETWFANEVDGPFVTLLEKLTSITHVRQTSFRCDPVKASLLTQMGYRVQKYIEYYDIARSERENIAKYIAALLVRSPRYLSKLEIFHKSSLSPKNSALDNMRHLHTVYFEAIMAADLLILRRDAENEFLFSDGGIVAKEPWSNKGGIPFDVHFPMTPDTSLQVIPSLKQNFPDAVPIFRAANRGISAQNRITLQYAENQVFGRNSIPIDFVMKNWGRPAPQHIMFRDIDGKLETKVDWSRFFH